MIWMALDPMWIVRNTNATAQLAADAWNRLGRNQSGLDNNNIWREFTEHEATILRLTAPGAWMEHPNADGPHPLAIDWYRQNRPNHPIVKGAPE
jgi:hypothetical protein